MPNFSITKRIAAPVEAVFEVATDLEHAAEHVRGIERIELLTPRPVGLGTRLRETRKMMGREATEVLEITAFDRPRNYTVGCDSCGAFIETTFRLRPAVEPSGKAATELTIDVRAESRSFFAKLLSPLSKLMFEKMIRGCLENDLEDIKNTAESRAAQSLTMSSQTVGVKA